MKNDSASLDHPHDSKKIPCPVVVPLSAILPEEPLLMMGAGPVPIPDAVAKANGVVINHLGSTMATVIGQVKAMARYVFQTQSKWVMGVAGPGSAAMEMAVTNLAWPGTRMLCVCNGFFSERMAEMAQARRCRRRVAEDRKRPGGRDGRSRRSHRALSSGNRDDRAGRNVEYGVEPQSRRDRGGGARGGRAGRRRCGLHVEHDAAADGRMGHRRRDHRRAKGTVVDSGRVAARVLRCRLAAHQVAPRAARALVPRRIARGELLAQRFVSLHRAGVGRARAARGAAARLRGDAGAAFRAPPEVLERAAGRHRGAVAQALRRAAKAG